jgi:hypothetical protein
MPVQGRCQPADSHVLCGCLTYDLLQHGSFSRAIPLPFDPDPAKGGNQAGCEPKPAGRQTGVAYLGSALGAKRLGLMYEMVPKVADFAVLAHPTYPASVPFIGARFADRGLQRID